MKRRERIILIILSIVGSSCLLTAQPVNDNPCDAIALTVASQCNPSEFTNLSATASGLPLTQCAAYSGGDVWFKVTVPYNGRLTISMFSEATMQFPDNNGWIFRPGIAVYRGTCSALVFDTCWIDMVPESPPGKPNMVLNDLTPGTILYLRIWEHSNNDNGRFTICAWNDNGTIPSDLFIPEAFSPNNDGLNDRFVIDGINNYPKNRLSVFNVWGNELFSMKQYDNSWDGTSLNQIVFGNKLPAGTYYYILDLGDGTVIKGFIYIKLD